jgi:hypothetical protein
MHFVKFGEEERNSAPARLERISDTGLENKNGNTPVLNANLQSQVMQNSHSDQRCTVLACRENDRRTGVAIREDLVDTCLEGAGWGSEASREDPARCTGSKVVDRRDWSVGQWMDL